ncbi:ankyrin repeat and SOCS box protein 6-like [Engraulis encrasicolus]|uniref:ankyrin repeat and SOCS box protein 6-like n=1 Tax=Engraulis encrasicolus TaxID=184585 RepID=UPI002FD67C01
MPRRVRAVANTYRQLTEAILSTIGLTEEDSIREQEVEEDDRSDDVQEVEDEDDLAALERFLQREQQVCDERVFQRGVSCALCCVARRGRLGAARTLLRYRPELDFVCIERGVYERRPYRCVLLEAVRGNHPLMLQLLVEHGADMNSRDKLFGTRALDEAVEHYRKLPCLRMLLQLGADVNARNSDGRTALIHAVAEYGPAYSNNLENIRLLLEGGACVNSVTPGDSAMWWVVTYLKEALDNEDAEEAAAVGRYCTQVANMLLDHGAPASSDVCPNGGSWYRRRREAEEERWRGRENERCMVSLSALCVEHFDLLFPVCVSLLSRGVPLNVLCSCHRNSPELQMEPCLSGMELMMRVLEEKLGPDPNMRSAENRELMDKALALIDISEACCVTPSFEEGLEDDPPESLSPSHPVLELRERLDEEYYYQLPSLSKLCRRSIRQLLAPSPLESKVALLPLPQLLKDFLIPEVSFLRRPGWDRLQCRTSRSGTPNGSP